MTLSLARRLLYKTVLLPAVAAMAMGVASCNSMIYDDQGDCSVHYKLSFRFTKNILDADAFGSQVTNVNVAIYDGEGKMVYKKSENRTVTTENNYQMDIDIVPGRYDIVAWCEGTSVIPDASSFVLDGQSIGDLITGSGAHLDLLGIEDDYYYNRDLNPLYHGTLTNVDFPDSYGIIEIDPIYLTKDTNHIVIQLQNMNGEPIDPDQLIFSLEASNNELDWQNNPVGDTKFCYNPWSVKSTFSTSADPAPSRSSIADGIIPNGVQAEFTTGRIIAGREQTLTVRVKDNVDPILSIPLIETLLLVRSNYQTAISNQDYLDRVDDYTLVFFIDEAYVWDKSRIFINNWRVVPPQDEKL